jgi:hypothetical protein
MYFAREDLDNYMIIATETELEVKRKVQNIS